MFRLCISCASVTVIVIAYYVFLYKNERLFPRNSSNTIIGILSARENFKQRQIIRDTWLHSQFLQQQGLGSEVFKHFFIIGSKPCDVPPQCQKNKYSCERWDINISAVTESFHTCGAANCTSHDETFHQGFSFQVNHPVVVTRLGVLSKLLLFEQSVQISLRDLQSQDVVVNTTISNFKYDQENDGFLYRNVANFLLPKDYRGLLLIEGPLLKSHCSALNWNTNSGIISFERIFPSSDIVESMAYSRNLRSAPSIGFEVVEMADLNMTSILCTNSFSSWQQHNQNEKDLLEAELKANGDILFVDIVDSYRALPSKLLLFYDWLVTHYNFDFMVKTDDDCVIDLTKVMKILQDKELFNAKKIWIWSRFRSHWPVNYVGKWADYDYKSPVYPAFPCGAGYVLSYQTVCWLQRNKEDLFPYQGEDVSLGIWLSAINPQYINDERWECDELCSINSLNRAQLHLEDIVPAWKLKAKCDNICNCGET